MSQTINQSDALPMQQYDPAVVYAGVSTLSLTETEQRDLSKPFDELDYEIRPDGHIYLPQAIALRRINDVLGIGRWGLLLINSGQAPQPGRENILKVFYDGALMVRGCFVSRSCGESIYNLNNSNQSFASALEAAKTDCRQRCCKDLGIATDAWVPSFIRSWKEKHAIRVRVSNNGKESLQWRRKDVPPLDGEIAVHLNEPHVNKNSKKQESENKSDDLFKKWEKLLSTVNTMADLTNLYNSNKHQVDSSETIRQAFMNRRAIINNNNAAA